MSFQCALCGKGKLVGKNVSHAKNRTRKISLPNLHRFNGVFQGQKGHWLFCTKCLRRVKSGLAGSRDWPVVAKGDFTGRKVKANQPKLVKKEVLPVDSPLKTASK